MAVSRIGVIPISMTFAKIITAFIFSFLLLVSADGVAQHKIHREATIWPELQVDYVFKSTSYFYFRNHYRHNLDEDFNFLRPDGPLKYLERLQFRAGFEHMFNANWSGGIAESYAIERTRKILFNEIFLRHLGTIGKVRFTKRASFEHIARWGQENYGRARLRADLDREYKLGKTNLKPRIAYELFFNFDYNADATQNNRNVDRTRLRLEVLCPITDHIAVTPFFTKQTDYFVVESTYDANGTVIREGGKQNHITPVFGLDLRYAFFKGGTPFPRTIQANK